MKIIVSSILLVLVIGFPLCLRAWEVTDTKGGSMVFQNDSLTKLPMVEIQTERDKKGKHLSDQWKGFVLKDWLKNNGYTDFGEIVFESSDHYQVRLSRQDLEREQAIIAIFQNGKPLPEKDYRLILPGMRDMYWISNIVKISLHQADQMFVPTIVYWAEPILKHTKLKSDIAPFVNMKGYSFTDLLEPNIPFPDGDVLVMGKDGVKHLLDYRKYLRNAVLEKTDSTGYWLKSPNMPAGMWIKNLAYVQFARTAMIFTSACKDMSLQDIADFLSWKNAHAFIPIEDEAIPGKIRSWENKELVLSSIRFANPMFTHYPSIQIRIAQ